MMCTGQICGPNSLFFDNVFNCCQCPCPPKCCVPPAPRTCQKLCDCRKVKPDCSMPIGGCGCTSCGDYDCCYPPDPCERHPCFPSSCRKVPKCAAWPMCPCGRPYYKAIGPIKYCCPNPLPFPPCPECPCPEVPKIPQYPRLYGRKRPFYLVKHYVAKSPAIVRDIHTCSMPKAVRPRCCCRRCCGGCCCSRRCCGGCC